MCYILLLNGTFKDFFIDFYAVLTQNVVVAIFTLFQQIFCDWKSEFADFFAFRMYATRHGRATMYKCIFMQSTPRVCLSVHSLVCLLSHVALGRLLSYVARTHTHLWACATRTAWVTQPERPKDEIKRPSARRMCKKLCRRFSIILEAFWQIWSYKVNAKFEQRCSTDI